MVLLGSRFIVCFTVYDSQLTVNSLLHGLQFALWFTVGITVHSLIHGSRFTIGFTLNACQFTVHSLLHGSPFASRFIVGFMVHSLLHRLHFMFTVEVSFHVRFTVCLSLFAW